MAGLLIFGTHNAIKEFIPHYNVEYVLKEFTETNKKTIKLPNGTLSIRKQPPKYIYNDEEVLSFLKENNLNDSTPGSRKVASHNDYKPR